MNPGSGFSWPWLGGALASAFLLALAHPPFSILPLPFLALVPLAISLGSMPVSPGGRWRAAVLGMVFGVGFWGPMLIWVPLVVGPFFSWAFPGFLFLVVLLGALSGLFARTTHFLFREKKVPLGLALPLAWVGVEWLKTHFPFGLAFPWLGMGATLTGWPSLAGAAEWVGEEGISFWLVAVNGLVAGGILKRAGGRSMKPWILAVAVAVIPASLGIARSLTLPLSEGPNVVVVGTNVPAELRLNPGESARRARHQVTEALGRIGPGIASLVVLPEATIPYPIDGTGTTDGGADFARIAADLQIPLIVGALGRGREEGGKAIPTNSMFLFSPKGSEAQRYDKVHLVPGMEAGAYHPGPEGQILRTDDLVVGPLLCYESLFAEAARSSRRAGAEVLVNISSDIWFGEGGSFMGSLFLSQHPSHLVMRALENRISVARAANGGFSFLLDPLGRVLSGTVPPEGGLTQAQLSIYRGTTLFSRTGDWVGPGAVIVCILLVATKLWRGPILGLGKRK